MTLSREAVFVARRMLAVADFVQDTVLDEGGHTLVEDVAGDPQPLLKLIETVTPKNRPGAPAKSVGEADPRQALAPLFDRRWTCGRPPGLCRRAAICLPPLVFASAFGTAGPVQRVQCGHVRFRECEVEDSGVLPDSLVVG
jgi:hypothetical protein